MNLIHTNGHAASHLVQPQRMPRLIDMQVELGRPAGIPARKARPAEGEAKPQPNEPPVTPTPPTAPRGPAGKGKGRKPAKQSPPARKKAPVAPHRPTVAKKGEHATGKATGSKPVRNSQPEATGGEGTKKAQVLALLRRSQGATLAELVKMTGWQSHSVRGFLSGSLRKKMGLKVRSGKRADGVRVYSVRG